MVGKTSKAPTEKITFSDAWNGFKVDYLEFVSWASHPDDDFDFIIIKFEENEPTAYINKWNREQYKIKVSQDGFTRILSAGKRLFIRLKDFCVKENLLPIDLGSVEIHRIGKGFETDFQVYSTQKTD